MKKIQRALISVSDKTGLLDLANVLTKLGVEIYSTGGTLKFLLDQKIPAKAVESYTEFPEMMDGRVKTLHPKIHGGLLARRNNAEHVKAAEKHGILFFDLVCINLYPFEKVTADANVDFETAIENIDIGGPAMIRSAAKNAESVAIIVQPSQYAVLLRELAENAGATTAMQREAWRLEAYQRTAEYDRAISTYLLARSKKTSETIQLNLQKKQDLRYGENPHQSGGFFSKSHNLPWEQLHGKELSFNNILDIDIALKLGSDFENEVVAIFKHTNPCGVSAGKAQPLLVEQAMACDPVSFFGGIVVFNRPLSLDSAKLLAPHFFEVIIAPEFDKAAFELLAGKKNLRLIRVDFDAYRLEKEDLRSAAGGYLLQQVDQTLLSPLDSKIVTEKSIPDSLQNDLLFAFRVAKFVKSNAVVFAKDERTLAIGAGQMSRIDSIKIAVEKAREAGLELNGSVIASEAFFPFRDSVDTCAKIGVSAIIQPGGSIKDAESIAAANEHGIAMMFTGMRHFRH